jgi:hypothetical protein
MYEKKGMKNLLECQQFAGHGFWLHLVCLHNAWISWPQNEASTVDQVQHSIVVNKYMRAANGGISNVCVNGKEDLQFYFVWIGSSTQKGRCMLVALLFIVPLPTEMWPFLSFVSENEVDVTLLIWFHQLTDLLASALAIFLRA